MILFYPGNRLQADFHSALGRQSQEFLQFRGDLLDQLYPAAIVHTC